MPEHLNKPEETGEMTQQAYNEIVKVRHEKLKALRDAGKDPFVITKYPAWQSGVHGRPHDVQACNGQGKLCPPARQRG